MVDHFAFDAFASQAPTASSATDSGAALGTVIGLLIVLLVTVGLYVLVSIALGRVFLRLGEQGWKAWIPVVNAMTLLELGGYSALWAFAAFVPGLNIVAAVFEILAINNVNRRLGKGGGYTLLAVLLYPVWACLLGFGNTGRSASETTGLPAVLAPTASVPGGPQQAVYSPQQSAFAAQAPSRAFASDGVTVGSFAGVPQQSVFPPALPSPPAPFAETHGGPLAPRAPVQQAAPPELPAPPAASPTAHRLPNPPAPFWEPVRPAVDLHDAVMVPVPPVAAPVPVSSPVSSPIPVASPVTGADDPWAPPPALILARTSQAPIAAPLPQAPAIQAPLSRADLTGVSEDSGHDDAVLGEDVVAVDTDGDDMEATRISARRAKPWILETETGVQISLTSPVVFLGRNPARSTEHPDAQLVPVVDTGKTVSKSHARIDLSNGVWTITDLHSTNGIVLIDGRGDERELVAGASALLTERFLLGELPARIFLET